MQHNGRRTYVNNASAVISSASLQYGTRYHALGCRILRFYRETAGSAWRGGDNRYERSVLRSITRRVERIYDEWYVNAVQLSRTILLQPLPPPPPRPSRVSLPHPWYSDIFVHSSIIIFLFFIGIGATIGRRKTKEGERRWGRLHYSFSRVIEMTSDTFVSAGRPSAFESHEQQFAAPITLYLNNR